MKKSARASAPVVSGLHLQLLLHDLHELNFCSFYKIQTRLLIETKWHFLRRFRFLRRLTCLRRMSECPVVIDGSVFEGGGQTVRIAVGLSVILNRKCQISNIRAGRPKPGLRGVAVEVVWYPKSDFEIVTRVTPDLRFLFLGLYFTKKCARETNGSELEVWSDPSYDFEILFRVPHNFYDNSP